MKDKLIIFCLLIFIGFSCKETSIQKEFYYKTGELKQKIVYPDKKDTTTFHDTSYYKNGNPMKIKQVKNGQLEGKVLDFFKNGVLEYVRTYKNGKVHGLAVDFNQKKEVIVKCFVINGKPINTIEYAHTKNKEYIRETVFQLHIKNDTTFKRIGHLVYTDSNNIIDSSSFYYNIEAKDTINYGDSYRFSLTFHNDYNYSLKLLIGELNEDLNFVNPDKINTYTSPRKTVRGETRAYEPGWNLLLGKLYVYPDPQNKHPNAADEYEFIVFKEFYVKGNK
jgi:hypothetical protein